MKASRFTTEQIIGILQEHAAGARVAELMRRHGISRPTLYAWKKKYGDLQLSEAKRLRALEDEDARLKRLVAQQALNLQILKDVLGKGR
ncbi:transposase [Gemmatimonas aurantiaca]|uniref:transposase n=1 Tax=Gemmatimonas aurantiaca TaxID=173480 RepID=UPI00301C8330